MKATADLNVALLEVDVARRRQVLASTLQATAQQSQAGVLAMLSEQEMLGAAANIRSLWIVNAVAAEADLNTVLAVAARPEVRFVREDREYRITERPEVLPGVLPDPQAVQWNIAQIRADLVRGALRVDGRGAVVANIDTGVDFLHPALHTHYRGYDSHGLYVHACNWFDATGGGATYPVDGNGHGTHTMGTMVGGQGIGVAPGAAWVAVRAFDSQGIALESWLHAAMQWIVEPGPGCTPPDIVNSSWSSSWGGIDVFRTDVQVLRAAGIFAPFAAGNNGPAAGSIDAPASYPEAFAVGAVSAQDMIASFSGRGPSTWYSANLVKPDVTAPGVQVLSSLPGGTYGESDGTSMATPHVAGLAALMLQADPTLTVDGIEKTMESTAVPLGGPIPNNHYGWGRIDAYAAVAAVAGAGSVDGTVARSSDRTPIAGAIVTADPSTFNPPVSVRTESDGSYSLALAPDRYTLNASAFGYQPSSRVIQVLTSTMLTEDFSLAALPTGTLTGRITSGGQPVSPPATVVVAATPVSATTNATGIYTVYLPAGSYTVTATSTAHRVGVATTVAITAGQITTLDFDLETAPNILLVDSGVWYYNSEIDYYRQALDGLRYTYDLWTVDDPTSDVPSAQNLLPYDIVFWSSPEDSPGYIGASEVLTSYLRSGGSLFLSGQDVAYYDDYYPFISAPYFRGYLKARFVSDNAGEFRLAGVAGELFDGLTFVIDGSGGADNQVSPDVIEVVNPDYASSIADYESGGSGGQQVGPCLPYRALYLSYGFEAIVDPAVRTEVISRSIAWFEGPPISTGLELSPQSGSLVGDFGQSVAHEVRIRNLAETGGAVNFTLTPAGHNWATSVFADQLFVSPCQSVSATVVVQVPSTAGWAASDRVSVTVQSARDVATVTRQTRAPAPVLLVDDDRWYNVEDDYRNALDANGIPYDEWKVPWSFSSNQITSPPLDTLRMYPMVLWFSAYDWYQPLTAAEEERLGVYLDHGGRLYYNGQDYLYYTEGPNGFARTYLGVEDYTEDFTSTTVVGLVASPLGYYLGPYEVVYPYKNFSDALTPTASARVAFVGQEGQPNAVTNAGHILPFPNRPWRTAFFAFNPDGLDETANVHLLRRVTGWLSWLGGSTLTVDKGVARDTDTLTYTLVLRNDGWQAMSSAYFTATFPADLAPIPGSADGGAIWDAVQSAFVWSGPLEAGQSLTFTYQADIVDPLPPGRVVSHTVWMGYDNHSIRFDRGVTTLVNVPVLSQSTFNVTPTVGREGTFLNYLLQVRNTGFADSLVTASNPLPGVLDVVTGTLLSSGGNVQIQDRVITWTVPVAVGEAVTLTYDAVITRLPSGSTLSNRVILDDGLGNMLPLDAVAAIERPLYLPIVLKH
jgi:uncharacterized repeat protein (TIGR01451 family)